MYSVLLVHELPVIRYGVLENCICTFYRSDAQKLEEWARTQNAASLIEFSSREGEIEGVLKEISNRAGGKGSFSYSRFFAIGLFRLLELSNAMEPSILEKVMFLFCYFYRSSFSFLLTWDIHPFSLPILVLLNFFIAWFCVKFLQLCYLTVSHNKIFCNT